MNAMSDMGDSKNVDNNIGESHGSVSATSTQQQLQPLELLTCALDGSTLIEASAGTGKTWNICGLYLRLLLERQLTVDQILVVTFTKAATAELRDRIRSRLVEALDLVRHKRGSDAFIIGLLASLATQEDNRREKLQARLELALQSFDQAAIYTIHGFCQRALADTPFSAGIAFSVEMAQDDQLFQIEAVNDFWRRYLASDAATPELVQHLVDNNDSPEKFVKLLRRHASKPKSSVLWPAAMPGANSRSAAPASRLRELFESARIRWPQVRDDVQALLQNAIDRSDLNANSYKATTLALAIKECDAYFSQHVAALCTDKMRLLTSTKLESATKKGRQPPAHLFFAELDELAGAALHYLPCSRLDMLRELITSGPAAVRSGKRSKRISSFDDLMFNLYEALGADATADAADAADATDATDAADARGRHLSGERLAVSLRQRYPVALIDEFQDTDPLQFDIFHKIYQTGSKASLFLVGDPKQAIYSFRNADLHTYLQARQFTDARYTLASNQRSSTSLIEAMNHLFHCNERAFLLDGLNYHRVQCGERERKTFIDTSEAADKDVHAADGDLRVWSLPADSVLDRNDALEMATEATASEIARLINEARQDRVLFDGRPLAPGDIAVLVRSHSQAARIRRALTARNVASIEISQDSVFNSSDAADVEALLCALMEPARTGLLLAALATPLMGYSAGDVAKIADDERLLMQQLELFSRYRDLWFKRGLGYMYRKFLSAQRVAERLLCSPNGERCMTNLRHLGEYLQQATELHPAPEATLRWLQSQRRDSGADEAAQLRLESDQNLVQILTIHKSKGLEYPVVFCPFLWDALQWQAPDRPEGREYHDDDGRLVIDFRDDAEAPDAKGRVRDEECAERLRLIYVAMTRAAHRCYLIGGVYSRKVKGGVTLRESCNSMLNWLVAGAGVAPEAWFDRKPKPDAAAIDLAWTKWAAAAAPHVRLSPLAEVANTLARLAPPSALALAARVSAAAINEDWRTGSFSQILRNSSHGGTGNIGNIGNIGNTGDTGNDGHASRSGEQVSADHDAQAEAAQAEATRKQQRLLPAALAADDILRFPRGADAGKCLHAAFENADFTQAASWPQAITKALLDFPQPTDLVRIEVQQSMMHNLLQQVLHTPLQAYGHGAASQFQLAQIVPQRRLNELEFRFPSAGLRSAELNAVLAAHGYDMPRLNFSELQGFLKGFIDLVFEYGGHYYLLDWKSNHLGYRAQDYSVAGMAPSMSGHGYHLQYLLYTVALHRYLRMRIPGYSYETHIGGAYYLFVRGVRADWLHEGAQAGVFYNRPSLACIEDIESLFGDSMEREAA